MKYMIVISALLCGGYPFLYAKLPKEMMRNTRYNMQVESTVGTADNGDMISQKDELEAIVERQRQGQEVKFIDDRSAQQSQTSATSSAKAKKLSSARQNGKSPQVKTVRTSDVARQKDPNYDAPAAAYAESTVIPGFNEKEFTERRRKAVVALVEKGAEYLKTHPENEAMSAFTFNKEFIDGEIYLFVYNLDGVCLAQGLQEYYIWDNQWDLKDSFGNYIVRIIIESAKSGGGWVTYQWRNSTKITYVQQVVKDGQVYVIGAGYYPHSKRDSTVGLVRSAVELFKETVRTGKDVQEAFGKISYPLGNFVYGDLYLFALDFQGNIVAQGDRPGLIGQNSIDYRDAEGRYVNREIIEKLQKTTEGVWVEYESKRAHKITYAEKVTDGSGKDYFIACGYYPDAGRSEVVDLVRQGYVYMQGHGKSQAAEEFNSKVSNAFRYGDLYVMLYDTKGNCIAHGGNPDLIGSNQWDVQDEHGKYMVREMIAKAKDGGGWVDFMLKNAFWFVYAELVTLGQDEYVIASGLYPISKPETMLLLIKSAMSAIESNPRYKAFGQISERNGRFVRGDLDVFVFDDKGICYVWGEDHNYIRRQMFNAKDEDGREYVKLFINTAKKGPGRVVFKERGKQKIAYVEPLEKDGVFYVVGSSFFQ